MPYNILASLLQRSSVQGSKSTALGPLIWRLAILTGGLFSCHYAGLPEWVVGILVTFLGITVIAFLGLAIDLSAFGADFEYQRHNIRAGVAAHIDTANVAGEMPVSVRDNHPCGVW